MSAERMAARTERTERTDCPECEWNGRKKDFARHRRVRHGWQAPTPAQRFLAKVVIRPSGCWEWFFDKRFYQAHRWAFAHFVAPIPDGMFILHSCDNPPCVNPDHLRVGDHAENMRDRTIRGRRRTHCKRDHEFTPENTRINSDGGRSCRACCRERQALRRKEAA